MTPVRSSTGVGVIIKKSPEEISAAKNAKLLVESQEELEKTQEELSKTKKELSNTKRSLTNLTKEVNALKDIIDTIRK